MASGFVPALTVPCVFSVLRSKTVTVFARPLLETSSRIGCESNSMHTLCVRDVADDFAAIGVEHNDVRPMRDVDATSGAVYTDVVPTFIATDLNRLRYTIPVRGLDNLRHSNRKH